MSKVECIIHKGNIKKEEEREKKRERKEGEVGKRGAQKLDNSRKQTIREKF